MTTKHNFANTDAEKLLKYIINDVGHSKTVCAIVNEINNDYDYVDSIKYGRFSEINKFSIYNMENNPLKHNNIVMHNFGMEITYNKDGALNHMDLVKNFELDVEYKENKNGLIVSQLQNGKEIILKKPYDISDSARKINKETKDHPVGFSGISYAKKKNLVKYTCPPDIIPVGCWCDICKKCGPKGHDVGCTFPNFSSLKLTLLGYIKCLFSDDKSYQSKLLEISDSSKKRITFKFLNEVLEKLNENFKLDQNDETHTIDDVNDLVDVQIILDVKRLSMVLENVDDKFFIDIANKITRNDYFIAEYDTAEDKDISNIFTDFNLEDIKSIPGLNKSGKKEYFPGTVILQYSLLERKTTIRFYDDFIHFITVPLNADYKQIIFNVFKRFNVAIKTKYVPLNVTIEVAKGSFNVISNEYTDVDINLNRLYSSFHPVDKNKNPINKNDFMYTKEFMTPDDFVKKVNFTDFENSKFEFTITPPENKRMTMTFIEYNKLSNPGYYKITAQIHSSGIIQLTFGYTEGSKEYVKLDNSLKYNQDEIIQVGKGIENLLEYQTNFINHLINYQLNTTVKKSFSTIKNLFYSKLSEIFDKTPDIFMRIESKKKSSDMIYNIIPGIMPYRKKIFPHAGNLVDFFDDENPEYSDNHGWSNTDNDRGYIVEVIKNKEDMPNTYKIIKGIPKELKILKINQLDKNFIPDKLNICPIVKTTEGDAYLLEEYEPDEKDKFWTISVDYGSKEYEYKSFRIYRYSITGKFDKGDVQVCSKTVGEGIEMRPEPYSFYGRCPGGLNETVNPIGLRSRKDNKFYPVCEKIKDRNTADKDTINFLLNGLNEKQLYEADIDPNAEFELHGEKLEDKYAGTFRPGTIDRGNKITFWNKDELNPKWLEGIIIDYKKDHGLGNDLNYVKFIVDVDTDENEDEKDDEFQLTKKYEVYGEQFHPKHREKRNFEGLNKLIPDKEKQKQFVISCAKKLNLVKPSIPLMEVSDKNKDKILQSLNKLFKKQFDFSTSLRKIKPFVKNNILELSKNYHLAAMIPSYGIRCLLYLENENEQYVISPEENIMSVTIVSSDDMPSKTLIEGYITETKLFYPIDLIYYEGKLLTTDYINYSNDGRLYLLQNIVSNFNTTMSYSNSIKILPPLGRSAVGIDESDSFNAFVGPSSEKTNLLKFVKNNIENNNIIFINKHHGSNLLIWLNNVPHLKIVLQLVKKHEKRKHTWYMGLIDDNDNEHVLLSIPISLDKSYKEGDYVKFKINMMSNGIINEYNPYIDITKSSEEYSKDIEDTINSINLIMYSVEKDVFMNTNKWEFPSIKKTYHPGENFRSPLVE